MHKFIKNVALFIAIAAGAMLLTELCLSFSIDRNANFKLDPIPSYVIFGHSHPTCAYNDSLILHFRNAAEPGESYYYTYFKVKEVLAQNPSIKGVFIEYTNNQISSKMDDWTWDDKHLSDKYVKHSPFISLDHQLILILNNPKGYLNSFSYSIKHKISLLLQQKYDYSTRIGGYSYLVRSKMDSILKHSAGPPVGAESRLDSAISEVNLSYLRKTIDFAKERHKTVFLVRTPLHPKHPSYKNESLYQSILINRFNDIEYLDFSTFPLLNSEFVDLGHLNHKGAKVFSEWFNELINSGLLTTDKKQDYIDKKIAERVITSADSAPYPNPSEAGAK